MMNWTTGWFCWWWLVFFVIGGLLGLLASWRYWLRRHRDLVQRQRRSRPRPAPALPQ